MAGYPKSASGDVKRAMKRRKTGTLKRPKRQDGKKQTGDCDRTFGGSGERQEGSEQEVRMRAGSAVR
jgi:hypothetical protein